MDEQGDLVLPLGRSEVRLARPLIYQDVEGERRAVKGGYVRLSGNRFGLDIAPYDPRTTLVIDPVVTYSTYLGGSSEERGAAIAVDKDGNAYIAGLTDSASLADQNPPYNQDVFVTKLDAAGSGVIYTTYLGGAGPEHVSAVAVDRDGNLYVTGATASQDFPATGAIQGAPQGDSDVFVAKLDATGSELAYSTYLGGDGEDGASGIRVDSSGCAYLTGYTYSRDFPVVNAAQPKFGGEIDAFVTKVSADGASLAYSTFAGGSEADYSGALAVDSAGAVYIAGATMSTDFGKLLQAGRKRTGASDAFVTKVEPSGAAFAWSTLLGGGEDEAGSGVAVDGDGNVYVTGVTVSADFPVVDAAQPALAGMADVFVSKLNSAGSALLFSTYLGGRGVESDPRLAADSDFIYVAGTTGSSDFPTRAAGQPELRGGTDMFVARIGAAHGALDWSTYWGGSGIDGVAGCAVDAEGNLYAVGRSRSPDFPAVNAAQASAGGGNDAVVLKISR